MLSSSKVDPKDFVALGDSYKEASRTARILSVLLFLACCFPTGGKIKLFESEIPINQKLLGVVFFVSTLVAAIEFIYHFFRERALNSKALRDLDVSSLSETVKAIDSELIAVLKEVQAVHEESSAFVGATERAKKWVGIARTPISVTESYDFEMYRTLAEMEIRGRSFNVSGADNIQSAAEFELEVRSTELLRLTIQFAETALNSAILRADPSMSLKEPLNRLSGVINDASDHLKRLDSSFQELSESISKPQRIHFHWNALLTAACCAISLLLQILLWLPPSGGVVQHLIYQFGK